MFRHHLIIKKSHLYVKGVILFDALEQRTVHTFANVKLAIRWCRLNGWQWSFDGGEKSWSFA